MLQFASLHEATRKHFLKEKKEKKKAVFLVEGFQKASFLDQILPDFCRCNCEEILQHLARGTWNKDWIKGGDFILNPQGLKLSFWNTWNWPLLSFFIFLVLGWSSMFRKHPQAPQQKMEFLRNFLWGAPWRCCGNRTATAGRERSGACAVERSTASVKRRGKNITPP